MSNVEKKLLYTSIEPLVIKNINNFTRRLSQLRNKNANMQPSTIPNKILEKTTLSKKFCIAYS